MKQKQFDPLRNGPARKGMEIGNAKLTNDQGRQIRESNMTSKKLAEMYNVSVGCIDGIRSGKTWKHIK